MNKGKDTDNSNDASNSLTRSTVVRERLRDVEFGRGSHSGRTEVAEAVATVPSSSQNNNTI